MNVKIQIQNIHESNELTIVDELIQTRLENFISIINEKVSEDQHDNVELTLKQNVDVKSFMKKLHKVLANYDSQTNPNEKEQLKIEKTFLILISTYLNK